jgi:hypothetical protein
VSTEKLPIVDMKKWGDRILASNFGEAMPMTDAAFHDLVEQLDVADKPCGVTLDAQTLGRLFVDKCKPYEFNQFLFMQFKQAGCSAVEGVIKMKLTRGKIFKLRSAPGEMEFHYMWLPDVLCHALGVQDREGLVQ